MKKHPRPAKLILGAETLRYLDPAQLSCLVGGEPDTIQPPPSHTCSGNGNCLSANQTVCQA